jgi:hypothetical protein
MSDKLGTRHNEGKPQLSFLLSAPNANRLKAAVYTFGANKYGRDNWKSGFKYMSIIDSLMRHLQKFVSHEDIDEESGLPHVAHILWNAEVLAEMFEIHKDLDDRKDKRDE